MEEQDQSNLINENESIIYPSGELLLQVIQKEYEIEAARKRDIETRTGIFIALAGVLIGFYASSIDFGHLNIGKTTLENIGFIFLVLVYVAPICFFLITLKKLINLLNAKEYKRIGIEGINEEIASMPVDQISTKLAESYRTVVEDNGETNENKAKDYNSSIKWLYTSLIAVIVAYIISQICEKLL